MNALLLALVVLASPVQDLDDLLDEPQEEETTDVLESWKGFAEIKPRIYYRDRDKDRNNEQLLLEAEFELNFKFSESVSAYVRPRIFLDVLDGDLDRFEPYEAYVTIKEEEWDLRLGQFVENWGIADTYNPIDIINRRDFGSDILDADRLGELGARFRLLFEGGDVIGEPTLSFYALPVFRETRFATEDQRFGFPNFEEDDGFEPSGGERGLYAIRFQSTLDTAPLNADIQVLVARGPERLPVIFARSPVEMVPAYYGATTVGAGFRAVPNEDVLGSFLASLTLKLEVVYKKPYAFDDSPVAEPDDYLAYVVGVDRNFFNVLQNQDQISLMIEYAGERGADDAASRLRPFQNDIILRGLWELNNFARTSLEVRGLYDFETGEITAEAIFETQLRDIHENLKLSIQLQVFDPPGTGESFFDFFPNNSSLALGLRWDF